MNHRMVVYVIGRILIILGLLMLPSILVALIYREGWAGVAPFLYSAALSAGLGLLMTFKRPANSDYYMREGFVVVALSWILLSLLGALPFYFSGSIPRFIDCVFETASGFTTTGASILRRVEGLSHALLFWRSFTHFVGGMGVLVFALAVMPKINAEDVFVMKAEVPGPVFGKLRAKLRSTARILYVIYLCLTLVLILALLLAGVPAFDSVVHALGTAGTGGFGIHGNSVAFYRNPAMEYILGVAMIVFGINFNLFYALLVGNLREFFKSEELRWYLGIIGASIALIFLNTLHLYDSFARQFRDIFFTVSSIISTTGFSTANYGDWPLFSHGILLCLMFIGGMAGSTAGGLKVSRIAIYTKATAQEIRRKLSPNRLLPIRFEGKKLSATLVAQVSFYLSNYIAVFVVLMLLVSLSAPNFITAFSSVAATFNNIGPGLDLVGPAGSYASLDDLSKGALTLGMIMGRLEIFPIIVLFAPSTWRHQ